MRKFLQFPLMIVLSVLTFVACDKDDDDDKGNTIKNEITVNSETFKIEKGSQELDESYIEDEDLLNIDLVFELENEKEFVAFLILPAENKKLAKGTYTFDEGEDKPFTMFGGGIEIGDTAEWEITGGKIVIDVNGENYTVTLDIKVEDKKEKEEKLTGTYYGKLPLEDAKEEE